MSGNSRFLPEDFLDLSNFPHRSLFEGVGEVWNALPRIGDFIRSLGNESGWDRSRAEVSPAAHIGPDVALGPGVRVEPGATIQGPAVIGAGTVIRAGAYLRENVLVGNQVTMGNSCEFKNCLILDRAEVPHFNYVGDSILGVRAHLGAGVILSNVRLDRNPVLVVDGKESRDTGMPKFGAIVGDGAEIGCNAVLSPGSVIGRDSILYPGTHWSSGVLPARSMVKVRQEQVIVEREG